MGRLTLTPASGPASPQHRRAHLEEAVALFGFYDLCGELQSWLENQTALLQMLQPQADDNVEVAQLKYEVPPLWTRSEGLSCLILLPFLIPILLPPCRLLPLCYLLLCLIVHVSWLPVWEEGARDLALHF